MDSCCTGCFIPTPAQWVAKVNALMINSVHKHTGKKAGVQGVGWGEKALVYIGVLNAVNWIQFNYFLPMALN